MILEQPKWKKFEEFVASIQKQLTPNAVVAHNEKITGKSGVERQLDIVVRYNLGQFNILVVMDCKDWKKPVDIGDVGAFCDQVEDVGANKGAIVCNVGFTEGAIKRAQEKGIDLLRAVDAENMDWPGYIAIPALCDFRYVKSFNFRFVHRAPTPFSMPAVDPKYLGIYNKDGSLRDILVNLLTRAWNQGMLPDKVGEHNDLRFFDRDAYTKVGDTVYGPVEITSSIIVDRKLYFGAVPLSKGQGFQNVATGAFTTKCIEWGIDVVEVEQKWRKLTSIDELAVKATFTLMASDCYPIVDLSLEQKR